MKQVIATITSKGQLTLPAEVRRHLGVATRDKVVFVIDEDGTVRLEPAPYPTIASLRGAAGSLPQPLPWKRMVEIAREDYVLDEYGEPE